MIEASVVLDSVSLEGIRLVTWKLRYPRFIHAEVMTHRVFSRNASSSRAVPIAKSIEEASNPDLRAAPLEWGRNQKGMQAKEFLSPEEVEIAKQIWADAARDACIHASRLEAIGAHKQIVNRILEPYLHINVVISSTEMYNFFGLRLDADAQPECRILAEHMWPIFKASKPKLLKPGEWHLPFVRDEEIHLELVDKQKISVARCARTSFQSYATGKVSTVDEDIQLYGRLLDRQPIHASPAEHQATPDLLVSWQAGANDQIASRKSIVGDHLLWMRRHEHGNFYGWRQLRKMLPGERQAPLPEPYQKDEPTFSWPL